MGSKACWHAELGCEVLWKAWGKLHQSRGHLLHTGTRPWWRTREQSRGPQCEQGGSPERVAGPDMTRGGFWTGGGSKARGGRPGRGYPGSWGDRGESAPGSEQAWSGCAGELQILGSVGPVGKECDRAERVDRPGSSRVREEPS